jgi:hypothetical protein
MVAVLLAAHHEAAHAVACAALGLPLQESGIHIDTIGGGITFSFHRTPGDLDNSVKDVVQRERSIVMIKAGYAANLKLFSNSPTALAADDRLEECKLLGEMHPPDGRAWTDVDQRLSRESRCLVDERWEAIQALAQSLLAKPIASRPPESFRKWSSPDPYERCMGGDEVAAVLGKFRLTAIIRKESECTHHPPDV